MREGYVGLFFCIDGVMKIYADELDKATEYGDYLIYDKSHFEIWYKYLADDYGVDFDYYPRGRVAYRTTDDTFLIFYDRCIEKEAQGIKALTCGGKYEFVTDEHYVCHKCNENYCI